MKVITSQNREFTIETDERGGHVWWMDSFGKVAAGVSAMGIEFSYIDDDAHLALEQLFLHLRAVADEVEHVWRNENRREIGLAPLERKR